MILFNLQLPIYIDSGQTELVPVVDERGFETGEYEEVKADPKLIWSTVTPARLDAEDTPFGTFTDYSHVLTLTQRQFFESGITENTYVWLAPRLKAINHYNSGARMPSEDIYKKYIVRRIAEGAQWVQIALSEVSG